MQFLAKGAQQISSAATALSNSIKQFEAWLSSLPGRTETTVAFEHDSPVGSPLDFAHLLRFHREGKSWVLSVGWVETSEPESAEFTRLNDAPIETKAKAAKAFTELLEAMAGSQAELLKQINEANEVIVKTMSDFDAANPEGA
jgi:hypothetical protein